jgi:hypothetical protein
MAQVKIWNDNVHPLVDEFKEQKISIPPGGFIEMDYLEACDFAGKFSAPRKRGDGSDDPRFFRMLRVEQPKEQLMPDMNVVHATGERAASAAEISAMTRAFAAMNPDRLVADKDLDTVQIKKTDLDAVMARLEVLESERNEKRGPGRPKKEA